MDDLVKSGGSGLVGLLHGKGGEISIPKPFEKDILKKRLKSVIRNKNKIFTNYQKEKVNLLSQFVIAFHNCISVATNTDFREESIYNIIHDRDYTNAKANAKKYVYFCVCFGIIHTDRNDTGGSAA